MKCFGECPPDCDLECGYAEQFHSPHVAAPPTRREWLLTGALLVIALVLSFIE